MSNTETNANKNNWISHAEWVVMFITIIGSFYALHSTINECNSRFDQFLIAWNEEAKDFHGRLCAIEEKNKKG